MRRDSVCEQRLAVTAAGRRCAPDSRNSRYIQSRTLTRRIYTPRDVIGVSCKNVTRDIKRTRLLEVFRPSREMRLKYVASANTNL